MSDIQSVTLLQRMDRAEINLAIAAETAIAVKVYNQYTTDVDEQVTVSVNDMDTDTLEAFKVMTDAVSYALEANSAIVKVGYNTETKVFAFGRSYLRDKVETDDVTSLADGFEIAMRVEFAGFEVNEVVNVAYQYNVGFSGPDKTVLADAGVVVTTVGTGFSLTNTRECKVYFGTPEGGATNCVIVYPEFGSVIPV